MTELTPTQLARADEIAAQCIGQCQHSPESLMTKREKNNRAFLSRIDEQVFYCEGCGWYCETEECHVGDLCDDCHDEREDGLTDD